MDADCVFCKIISGSVPAEIVYEDSDCVAFLDSRPVFHGHALLCPREHYETLSNVPADLIGPLFTAGQLLAKAVESAMTAEGTFVAINNRVSQTVPHLHIHIVPRRRRDGLRGFFWPRQQYGDPAAQKSVGEAIRKQVEELLSNGSGATAPGRPAMDPL